MRRWFPLKLGHHQCGIFVVVQSGDDEDAHFRQRAWRPRLSKRSAPGASWDLLGHRKLELKLLRWRGKAVSSALRAKTATDRQSTAEAFARQAASRRAIASPHGTNALHGYRGCSIKQAVFSIPVRGHGDPFIQIDFRRVIKVSLRFSNTEPAMLGEKRDATRMQWWFNSAGSTEPFGEPRRCQYRPHRNLVSIEWRERVSGTANPRDHRWPPAGR